MAFDIRHKMWCASCNGESACDCGLVEDALAGPFGRAEDALSAGSAAHIAEREPVSPRDALSYKQRKELPLVEGLIDYFPDACLYVSHISFVANEQHNPGEHMHWAREKSIGRGNEIGRHIIDRGKLDTDKLRHSGKLAWRAMELLQREIEADRARGIDMFGNKGE